MLGLTVGIHELGHFLAAVTRGIHVTKFSIGFGPTLLKWQVGLVVSLLLRLRSGAAVQQRRPAARPALLPRRSRHQAAVLHCLQWVCCWLPVSQGYSQGQRVLLCSEQCNAGQGGGVLAAPAATGRLCGLP